MKAFLLIGAMALIGLMASTPPAAAQSSLMTTVTKITSATTSGGTVLFEDVTNKAAIAIQKGRFYVRTAGYTGGTATFVENGSGKVIWRGPVSALTITGYATDSLKVLYLRQFLTN